MSPEIDSSKYDDLFFASVIASYYDRPRFVRRDWLADEVAEKFKDPECRFVFLTAEPGSGKSAFMAQLAHDHPDWPRYFIRRDQRTPLGDVGVHSFLLRIGYQLAAIFPELFTQEQVKIVIEQRIGTVEEQGAVTGADVKRILASPFYTKVLQIQQQVERNKGTVVGLRVDELVIDPRLIDQKDLQFMALFDPASLLLKLNPGKKVVILVDALDEIRYHGSEGTLLKWLIDCPELPHNVRFILTSRPLEGDVVTFCEKKQTSIRPLTIKSKDNRVHDELKTYVEKLASVPEVAASLKSEKRKIADFVSEAVNRADGNIGYLDAFARGIDQALTVKEKNEWEGLSLLKGLLSLRELPKDMQELYAFFLHQIKNSPSVRDRSIRVRDESTGKDHFLSIWTEVYKPALGVLSVAFEPLSADQIRHLGGIAGSRDDVIEAKECLRQFLDEEGDRCRFYHATMPEFLTSGETKTCSATTDLFVDPRDWHRKAVCAYRDGASSWKEAKIEGIDDYGLAHLASHSARAEWAESLHELISERWAAIKEQREGSLTGFLADTAVAWAAADASFDIALQVRYALVSASVHSMSSSLPPSLLGVLLDQGIWTSGQALRSIEQITDEEGRATALSILAPRLTAEHFDRAYALARSIQNVHERVRPLAALSARCDGERRDEITGEMFALLRAFQYESTRAYELARIAGVLPPGRLAEAIDMALLIPFADDRAVALGGLIPFLPTGFLTRVAEELRTLAAASPKKEVVEALAALARRQHGAERAETLERAQEAVLSFVDDGEVAEAFAFLVPEMTGHHLERAVAKVRSLGNPYARAEAIAALLPRCSDAVRLDLVREGREAVRYMGGGTDPVKVRAMAAFISSLSAEDALPVLEEALAEARGQDCHTAKAIGLALLIPWTPDLLRDQLRKEALDALRQPDNATRRAEAIGELAPKVTETGRDELLRIALSLDEESARVDALRNLAGHLREDLLARGLDAAEGIASDELRFKLIDGLASHLPGHLLPRAISVARALRDNEEQAAAILAFALHAPMEECPLAPPELIAMIAAIPSLLDRIAKLHRLVEWLPESLRPLAWKHILEELRAFPSTSDDLPKALAGIVHAVPEVHLQEVLAIVDGIDNDYRRGQALLGLVPALPDSRIAEAVTAVHQISPVTTRAKELVRCLPRIPEQDRPGLIRSLLSDARSESERAGVIVTLASHLPPGVLAEVMTASLKLRAESGYRAAALVPLLPHLPEKEKPLAGEKTLEAITLTGNWQQRAESIAACATGGYLSGELIQRALAAAREIGDEGFRARALAALMPCLGPDERTSVLSETLGACRSRLLILRKAGASTVECTDILVGLALSASSGAEWKELFWEAYRGLYAHQRAQALVCLVPTLPPEERADLLKEALIQGAQWVWKHDAARGAWDRSWAWVGIIGQWQSLLSSDARSLWKDALHALAERSRADLLLDLAFFAPMVKHLGEKEAVTATIRVMKDVTRWWP